MYQYHKSLILFLISLEITEKIQFPGTIGTFLHILFKKYKYYSLGLLSEVFGFVFSAYLKKKFFFFFYYHLCIGLAKKVIRAFHNFLPEWTFWPAQEMTFTSSQTESSCSCCWAWRRAGAKKACFAVMIRQNRKVTQKFISQQTHFNVGIPWRREKKHSPW